MKQRQFVKSLLPMQDKMFELVKFLHLVYFMLQLIPVEVERFLLELLQIYQIHQLLAGLVLPVEDLQVR